MAPWLHPPALHHPYSIAKPACPSLACQGRSFKGDFFSSPSVARTILFLLLSMPYRQITQAIFPGGLGSSYGAAGAIIWESLPYLAADFGSRESAPLR